MTTAKGTHHRQAILTFLKRESSASVEQIMNILNLSKTATRAHLSYLEDTGAITRSQGDSNGRGRPPVLFSLTEKGLIHFPTQDHEILQELLSFLQTQNQHHLIKDFFTSLWNERRKLFETIIQSKSLSLTSLKDRLTALHTLLEHTNFQPAIKHDGDTITIRECNCPFPAAAQTTRIPCQLEALFLQEATGCTLIDSHFATQRTEHCTFTFTTQTEQEN